MILYHKVIGIIIISNIVGNSLLLNFSSIVVTQV